MRVNSGFTHDTLIIISSLRDGDSNTARRLYEHLETNATLQGRGLRLLPITSKRDFEVLMRGLVLETHRGLKPLIHFEMHGDKERGLQLSSGQSVAWAELVNCLRPINIFSGGNLVVGMATCHGFNAITPANILEPSPFYMLVAPSEEVEVGLLEAAFFKLYGSLFEPSTFSSVANGLSAPMRVFHVEEFFTLAIAKYFKQLCMGKGGVARREAFVSKGLAISNAPGVDEVRRLRKYAKSELRPNEAVFHQMADSFIVGRSRYKVTFEQVMALVQE